MTPRRFLSLTFALCALAASPARAQSHVDITWMSVTNMYYEIGPLGVVTDGYITRIPQNVFFGGKSGGAETHAPQKPDSAAVARVLGAIGGPSKVQLLLSGHSHWDHSFDTGVWATLTGARVIGPRTTCLQVEAQRVPAKQCTAVFGGEAIPLGKGVTMRVVRWNHSGDSKVNPDQHDPAELDSMPHVDPVTGGLRAGMAEDFPNGGGSRAYLFTVDGPDGRLSWFFSGTGSAVDLTTPIVLNGVNYGAPLDNLAAAMKDAGLTSVDLWIGSSGRVDRTGAASVTQLVLPVLKPKAFLPVHWDSFYAPFEAGVSKPYSDPEFEEVLAKAGVRLVRPAQYMDKWRLDRAGVTSVPNAAVKRVFGFPDSR